MRPEKKPNEIRDEMPAGDVTADAAAGSCNRPGDDEPADAASPHAGAEEKQRRLGSAAGGPYRPGAHSG